LQVIEEDGVRASEGKRTCHLGLGLRKGE
jgi:hypothetical protein